MIGDHDDLDLALEITSTIFPFMALNDVVEASANEIYVTQWIPYPYPKR